MYLLIVIIFYILYIIHTLFKDLFAQYFRTVHCSDYCTSRWSLTCHHFPPKKTVRLHSQRSQVITTFKMKLPVWGISESRDLCFEDAESSRWELGRDLQWWQWCKWCRWWWRWWWSLWWWSMWWWQRRKTVDVDWWSFFFHAAMMCKYIDARKLYDVGDKTWVDEAL